jgi:hypothetical protein
MSDVLRLPAEQQYQHEIEALISAEKNEIPVGWKMSPQSVLTYITQSALGGRAESGELGLPVTASGLTLPCGATCRWES